MKEIFINVDAYNSDFIKTIQDNNNAEVYKIYVLFNKRRIDLNGKTVKMAYLRTGTVEGDVINLEVTNAQEGEITLQITNAISKRDGVYSCQLAIYGADEFLEHTATFGLTVEANIFNQIANEIADSKDFTYLENILDKASKLSEKLKENTSSATNANSNLESNIIEANNINSKLLENTSTATSLNKNLESNIDLAKEVKETIKDLDTKNIEATEKIETLTGLNAKATELSNNINQALPLNSELIKNVESAKVANTNLAATNKEATSKNTELQASLEKTKEFINGLDGSQNIPQLRLDVTELKNGLKSNQALSYEGSSISAENTLEGRTTNMLIKGCTLHNLEPNSDYINMNIGSWNTFTKGSINMYKPNTKYTIIVIIKSNKIKGEVEFCSDDNNNSTIFKKGENIIVNGDSNGVISKVYITKNDLSNCSKVGFWSHNPNEVSGSLIFSMMIIEGEPMYIPTDYFEGIKSFGEDEKVEDKYKISLLSYRNLVNFNKPYKLKPNTNYSSDFYSCYVPKNSDFTFRAKLDSYLIDGNTHLNLYDKNKELIDYWGFSPGGNNRYINEKNRKKDAYYCKIENTKNNTYDSTIVELDIFLNDSNEEIYFGSGYDKKELLIKEPLYEDNIIYEDNETIKINRFMKQYTFTGDEEWIEGGFNNSKTMSFDTSFIKNISYKGKIISDKFKNNKTYNPTDDFEYIAMGSSIFININKDKLPTQDVEGFKAWLKANPITVVYQLDKPVTEIVENCVDIDLDTYQEKTYFNILNSLPGTLDFKVPSNIASIVQNTAREVNNIWDIINNLLVPSLIDINKNVAMSTIKNNLK
ncbi:DUF2479 domain-containing protein [Clostridium perfringens]